MMLMAFFDIQGSVLLAFKEPDVSINAQLYTQALDKLHKFMENKCPGMLSSGVIILSDNARPHVAKVFVEALDSKKLKVLEHLTYSPDLSLCDYHIFELLSE
ncbi:histone-lysine N-methyltransferase SETMAR [Trichonephila inaurata madagascariensis]|uniref:Histone-lysine N-methyltransferase SETMAR n=1 Tax=Trichonephila inaurata madagascariensis TaxID=2747483 RepID=A0A8X6XRW1_9ARAC|nr:histone-lysine N-methyltransferase SETMAR [Trichonephila inaurata madagascariensis]